MKVMVGGVDLSVYTNVDAFVVLDTDLSNQIATASGTIRDEAPVSIPHEPRYGDEVLIYEDGVTLDFGGYIRRIENANVFGVAREWRIAFDDYNVRATETATGSLNKSGITDSDRNFVIAIFRDALKAQTFGSGTGIDDPIITANEPNWPGVQATTFLSGLDWSYMSPKNAMDNLLKYVDGVDWRIGPDKILKYGPLRDLAPFVVTTSTADSTHKNAENYGEEFIVHDHRNKMRRGGAASSEATAFDEVSYARFGLVIDDGYKNDSNVPAGQVAQRAYAELATRPIRRRAPFRVYDKGLKAGQLVDVVDRRLGSGTHPWPWLNVAHSLAARSVAGGLAGERGRFLITKVKASSLGRNRTAYDIECGDKVKTLTAALASVVDV